MSADRKYEPGGYMTLEAAFIVPWVIFMIVWLMYLGFFEYDRCLAFQEDYLAATQTAGQIMEVSSQSDWLNGYIGNGIGSKYMGAGAFEMTGSAGSKEVTVSTSVRVSHPLSYHADMIPSSNWNITDKVSADNFSFTKRLRLQRAADRVL